MKKHRRGLTAAAIGAIFLLGLALLLYPSLSNYWNTVRQAKSILGYSDSVSLLQAEEPARLRAEAEEFNRALAERPSPYALPEDMEADYAASLCAEGSDVMCYLEIPTLGVTLPVRHGTESETLQRSVGHLEWSSLPVGGKSTHCVLSGHRGLPSSELLTNIDRLERGDVFRLHVLGETLTYRVDRIAVVEPDDFSLLGVEEGEDYVTLLTCTPYGINSHRLLVRGTRVLSGAAASAGGSAELQNELKIYDGRLTALAGAGVFALIALPLAALLARRRGKGGGVCGG